MKRSDGSARFCDFRPGTRVVAAREGRFLDRGLGGRWVRLIGPINASKFVKHFTKFLAKDSTDLVNTPDDDSWVCRAVISSRHFGRGGMGGLAGPPGK